MISLESSVGLGGRNNPIDVAVVQQLLKTWFTRFFKTKGRSTSRITPSLKINGECFQTMINLINNIQTTQVGMQQPDGRIDPLGATFKAILPQINSPSTTTKQLLFGPAPANTGLLAKVNPDRFRKLFIKQAGLGLTITKGEDLLHFFNFLQNDPNIKDIRWATYILATVHKETGASFKPVEETGKGKTKRYAKPMESATNYTSTRIKPWTRRLHISPRLTVCGMGHLPKATISSATTLLAKNAITKMHVT